MIRWLTGRWDFIVIGALGGMALLCLTIIFDINDRDRARHDATFLRQCAEAGYDAAKCRFFLTASGGGNNAAAMQLILQSAAH